MWMCPHPQPLSRLRERGKNEDALSRLRERDEIGLSPPVVEIARALYTRAPATIG